jgi:hypothetical protein
LARQADFNYRLVDFALMLGDGGSWIGRHLDVVREVGERYDLRSGGAADIRQIMIRAEANL